MVTDILKISEITGLSLRTLKRLDKHGFLKVTKSEDPIADSIRLNLKKGNRLTALQQLHLLRNPAARDTLGQWSEEIRATLRDLGDALNSGAPWTVSSRIDLAARRDKNAIEKVTSWLVDFIRCDPGFDNGVTHDHAYLAVRLLANVPEHQLELLARKVTSCLRQ